MANTHPLTIQLHESTNAAFDEKWNEIEERVSISPNDWLWIKAAIQDLVITVAQDRERLAYEAGVEEVRKIAEKMKQDGLQEHEDQEVDLDGRPTGEPYTYFSCKKCGGYDDCDCSGYNEALDDFLQAITDLTPE